MSYQRRRIRDPLHNLIEFQANEFENAMWKVLQTRPFQRLRRVKQLGFSEIVYPGATHTRFAHSLGVFHTARQLMDVINRRIDQRSFQETRANIALAASLVHDVGHGPFSHAFEEVGRRLDLKMASHETVSDELIRRGELSEALKTLGSGFSSDVADVVCSTGPKDVYAAVVSSQFDADRLDYMRRDRLMTGTHHAAIDFNWLLSNIEIGEVPYGVDEQSVGKVPTFVLGPKATYAAESYLLGLFQLYPTVYFHKATRGAEKLFSEVFVRVIQLARDGKVDETGLTENHPLVLFAMDSDKVENILRLDDTVVWGALSMMTDAQDKTISDFSRRLRDRQLYKCIDVRDRITHQLGFEASAAEAVDNTVAAVREKIDDWTSENIGTVPRMLIDQATREIYKPLQESKGPLNQIQMKQGNGDLIDVAKLSRVVAAIKPFTLLRVYVARNDEIAQTFVTQTIIEEASKAR